ncbi:MAG: putative Zn-dependent protease [Glaciecola sp.]|jgi:predicted Zn-dependent protease
MSQEDLSKQDVEPSSEQAPQPVYYQPPASHENHHKQMVKWLTISFTSLFVLAALFIFFADRILINLPFSAEKKFVRPYEEITRYFGDDESSVERDDIEAYLDKLTADIASKMNLPADMEVEVHYLDTDAVNAFATLGGHVFVCRGLMETLDDENSLAMIIGHELAHIKNRDPIVGMARGLTIQMLYSYLTGDYSSLNVSGLGSELGLSYFSREQERKADSMGIEALNAHYGHVAGFDSLFSALQDNDDMQNDHQDSHTAQNESNWFSSHPDLNERIADLTKQAESNNWSSGEVQAYPAHIVVAIQTIGENKVLGKKK